MTTVIADAEMAAEVIAARRKYGHDLRDEVWEGTYVIMPLGNEEHQNVATRLSQILLNSVDYEGGDRVYAGVNLSDRVPPEDWRENYRCPDGALFLAGTSAENRGSHWYGGPDLAVEVVIRGDRSYEKLDFYAEIGTKELLIIERNPWSLHLYRSVDGRLVEAANPGTGVRTETVDVLWEVGTEPGVLLCLTHTGKRWTVRDETVS